MAAWRRQDEPGTGGAGAPRPPSPPKSRLIAGRWSCTALACVLAKRALTRSRFVNCSAFCSFMTSPHVVKFYKRVSVAWFLVVAFRGIGDQVELEPQFNLRFVTCRSVSTHSHPPPP